ASDGDRLPRRARGRASEGDEPRPEVLGAMQGALPAHRRSQNLAQTQWRGVAGNRFQLAIVGGAEFLGAQPCFLARPWLERRVVAIARKIIDQALRLELTDVSVLKQGGDDVSGLLQLCLEMFCVVF